MVGLEMFRKESQFKQRAANALTSAGSEAGARIGEVIICLAVLRQPRRRVALDCLIGCGELGATAQKHEQAERKMIILRRKLGASPMAF